MSNQPLNEGLRADDLKDNIYPMFEVDTFRSKMGEDQDVCVLTFQAKDRYPAKDFMEFVEKGYPFVLDADVSAGENDKGEYAIFVEIERNENLAENIKELTYGLSKLTGIDDWEFKYYKGNKTYEASSDNLREVVPLNKHSYNEAVNRVKTENIKSFFTKTLMDNLTLDGNLITIHKPFGVSVQLEMVSEDDPQSILETNEDTITVDHSSVGEVFWLTKVLGDYNIDKIGENFMFTNGDRAMLLKRV
jgi:hypothetical protein